MKVLRIVAMIAYIVFSLWKFGTMLQEQPITRLGEFMNGLLFLLVVAIFFVGIFFFLWKNPDGVEE